MTKPTPPLPSISLGKAKKDILACVQKGLNNHQISRHLNKDRSTIVEHLRDLQRLGLVIKDFYIWKLTEQGKNYVFGGWGSSHIGGGEIQEKLTSISDGTSKIDAIRLHDFEFNIQILSKPINWNNRRNAIFIQKGIEFIPKDLNNNGQETLNLGFNNATIVVTNNSVLVYPRDIIGHLDVYQRAISILIDILPKIEEKLGIQLVRPSDKYCKISVARQHAALMNNILATNFKKSKDKFIVEDKETGEVRLLIDYSKGVPEFEAVHYSYSQDDIRRLKGFNSDIIHAREEILLTDIRDMIGDLTIQNTKILETVHATAQTQQITQNQLNNLITAISPKKPKTVPKELRQKYDDYIG